jgi:hypothetical protein
LPDRVLLWAGIIHFPPTHPDPHKGAFCVFIPCRILIGIVAQISGERDKAPHAVARALKYRRYRVRALPADNNKS